MIEFVPFEPSHFARLKLQPAQQKWAQLQLDVEYARSLMVGHTMTGMLGGKPVGCAGLVKLWEGRGQAWALIGEFDPICWVPIVREMRKRLNASGFRRIEMDVAADFGPGCKLARLLGFEVEALRKSFSPYGEDYFLFARVRA